MLRPVFAALAAVVLLLAFATSAHAAGSLFVTSESIFYDSDDASATDLLVTQSAGTLSFDDLSNGLISVAGSGAADCSAGGSPSVVCAIPASAARNLTVSFSGATVAKKARVNGDRAATIDGGSGPDVLRGGNLADIIRGNSGTDELYGGPSPTTPDRLFGGPMDDLLDGEDGNDELVGGQGADVLQDTSTQETVDTALYFTTAGYDTFRTEGVRVSLDNVANDGAAPDDFADNVKDSVTSVAGTDFADVLVGSTGPNRLLGYGGADTITGGLGADIMEGAAGNDTINARDGVKDTVINCNNSDSSLTEQPNTAIVDGALETATNCSTVDTGIAGGGGSDVLPPGNGGGAPKDALTPPPGVVTGFAKPLPATPVALFPTKTYTMPDFARGSGLCKKGCDAARVKTFLDRQQLNYVFEVKQATSKALEAALDRDVEIGDVLYTDPKKGETIQSSAAKAERIRVYEFAPDNLAGCNLERPFIRIGKRLFRIADYLKGMSPRRAEATLQDLGCPVSKWEILDKVSAKAKDVTVTSVRVTSKKVELTVTSPPQRLRLYDVTPRSLGGGLPLVFSSSGALSIPDQKFLMWVRPVNDVGIGFDKADVYLRNRDGEVLDHGTTNQEGIAALSRTTPLPTGTYELWSYVCDTEGDCMVGTRSVKVVKLRKDRQYLGLDGKTYAASGDTFKAKAARAAKARPIARAATDATDAKDALGRAASKVVLDVFAGNLYKAALAAQPFGEAARAAAILNDAANRASSSAAGRAGAAFSIYYDLLIDAGVQVNVIGGPGGVSSIAPGKLVTTSMVASNGRTAAVVKAPMIDVGGGTVTLTVGKVTFAPGGLFYLLDGGGAVLGSTTRTKVDASSTKLDLVPVSGAMAVGLIGPGPASLVGAGAGNLVAAGAGNLVGAGAGNLVGAGAGNLVAAGAGNLVGAGAGNLVGTDGATLIGTDGASLVGAGAGNLIGTDGATLVGAGAGN